ncbi:unnamed protein product [Hymenolepis diminuta]|uniref:Serine incorporator 5 n=1 Tax=Hymenolepis diminuta TaxID=6216 RepID=A0A0R3SPE7_HYMDI|nr:unnamed protein product [Hymenolepis diminuta]
MDCIGRVGASCFVTKPMPICCVGKVKESTSTRFLYCCILTVVSILSVIFHTGGLAHSTAMRVFDDMIIEFCSRFQTREQCVRFVGFIAVYRFCIPLAILHIFLMLFTVTNTDSQSWRGKLHNGFWFWKCVFIVGLWIASIFIPALDKATVVWMLLAVLGGIAFIYLQNVFLIDFAYEFNGTWFRRSKKKPIYKTMIVAITTTLYLGTFTAYFVLWAFWGYLNSCVLNAMIVYVNVCVTGLLLFMSLIHPRIRSQCLYLPGAVTAAFAAYLTWSAVLSQPKLVVRDVSTEFQAIQFFNLRRRSNVSLSHQLALNQTGLLTSNICLPSFVRRSSALDHISDVIAALGIILVVFTVQPCKPNDLELKPDAKKWQKDIVRQLLAEVKEEELKQREEQMNDPASPASLNQSVYSYPPQETCTCFGTERHRKRRRMILEMLKEVAEANKNVSNSDSVSSSSTPAANSPPTRNSGESLRRKLLRKRLGISSANSAPQLISTPPRRSIELVAVGEIRPPPAVSSKQKNIKGTIGDSTINKPSTPPVRRRVLSDTTKKRPVSVCDMSPLPFGDITDSLSVDDVRLEKARKVTEYLAGDEGLHLLHENKEMAGSVMSFAEVLLPKRAPRDRFTIYNEAILTVYSYAWFHFTFCLATLYMMAQLTNWYNPELSSLQTVMESWANMWMKLFSAFLALLLYLWTLCFMRFCFNRSLIQTPLNPATHWVAKESENNHKKKEIGKRKYKNPSLV